MKGKSKKVDSYREAAAAMRNWANIHEALRRFESPEISSLMLDCANRLKGAARAHEELASAIERTVVEEDVA